MPGGVVDFVNDQGRQLGLVLKDGQHPGMDVDLAVGQGEGIGVRVAEEVKPVVQILVS